MIGRDDAYNDIMQAARNAELSWAKWRIVSLGWDLERFPFNGQIGQTKIYVSVLVERSGLSNI
jgi:hypothetical protein